MDSPASRAQRVLIGIALPLYLLTALAIVEGRIVIFGCDLLVCPNADNRALFLPALAFLTTIAFLYMHFTRNREHEFALLDKWISRESEVDMRIRLRSEQTEASGESLGTSWATMEQKHLEIRLEEEE